MIGYIYITTNLINNKKYIGLKTSEYFKNNYLGSGKIIKKAIKKYRKENFKVELLEECNSIEDLKQAERKWIKYYNAQSDSNFYNIAEGGQWGNCILGMSEEERKIYTNKLSKGIAQSYVKNPKLKETRAKNFSKANKGRKRTEKEKEHLKEVSKKMWEERREELTKIVQETNARNKEKGIYKNMWKIHKHP